ncbi:MAG: hypothetical protein SGPRY_002489 [Prymnesium sp.]
MGGMGRIDAASAEECAPAGMLPGAHDSVEQIRTAFNRMGFNNGEIVALSGAHTLGRCHPHDSGFSGAWTLDPLSFDNQYFKDLLQKHWASNGHSFANTLRDGTIMLDWDVHVGADPSFASWSRAFALDNHLFFQMFSAAFHKMSELGHSSLHSVSLPPLPAAHAEPAQERHVCIERKRGMCSASLQWQLHPDETVSATLQLSQMVGWLSLGVSEVGRMTMPNPSFAVVGSDSSVSKHVLGEQDLLSSSRTAPLDPLQDLSEASFNRFDGFSTLRFRTALSWFTRYANLTTGEIHLIYAHGEAGEVTSAFGYHANLRGSVRVAGFPAPRFLVTAEAQAQVRAAIEMISHLVSTVHAGPAFVRLAWNDAATFNQSQSKYGPRASMRFEPEASNPSNKGLDRARELLEPVKQAVPLISYADLWQLAAVVSIEMMGGPRIPFRAPR